MKILQSKEFKQNALKATLFSLFAWLVFGLFLEELAVSFLLAVLFGIVLLGTILYLPAVQRKRYAQVVEGQLPFALMNIAVEMNLGLKFEEILKNASEQDNEIGKEFKKVFLEATKKGASVQEALMNFSERIDSLEVKRAIALFVSVYEQGQRASGESVKMLAREMLAKQRAVSKEFSGKLVVYSLLFVAVSAIVPALFQSFAIVGSMVLNLTFTAQQIFLIIVLGFPSIDLAALYYIRLKTPIFLRE
jgi:flagellar protein FlaJ